MRDGAAAKQIQDPLWCGLIAGDEALGAEDARFRVNSP